MSQCCAAETGCTDAPSGGSDWLADIAVMRAGYAAVRQCNLQDMILSVLRLKEFVGRNLLAKPNLLGDALSIAFTCTWG